MKVARQCSDLGFSGFLLGLITHVQSRKCSFTEANAVCFADNKWMVTCMCSIWQLIYCSLGPRLICNYTKCDTDERVHRVLQAESGWGWLTYLGVVFCIIIWGGIYGLMCSHTPVHWIVQLHTRSGSSW